ncbi:MAG: HAD family hydrolase [Chloroflexi bacterium]|nr:HAD family hydrolase [Chloroflexota bacterium]
MKLIIFDLDQTLIDLIPLHDETMLRLFRQYFGVDAKLTEIDFAGKSLTQCFAELARLKSIPEAKFQESSQQLFEDYQKLFIENIPEDVSKYILPGVPELLEALSRTDNLVVLYTGEPPSIVKAVFQVTGFGKYFRFCQYGTRVKSRSDMVRRALRRAERMTGQKFEGKNIVIIGDSFRDIECGREFNARTIAVATGFHSMTRLAQSQPDYVFANLKDWRQVLKVMGA